MFRIALLVLYSTTWAYAQCPTVDFVAPASACKVADIAPEAAVTNAISYSWDFCDGSITNTPVSIFGEAPSALFVPYDIKTIEVGGNYFAFVVNRGDGKLIRFDFGNSFDNSPVQNDLGNFGVIINPQGIGLYKEGNLYYGLVATSSGKLFRLSFGISITSVPIVSEITGLVGLPDYQHMRFTKEGGNLLVFIAGGGSTITMLNFGSSIVNQPAENSITVPGSQFLLDLDIINECNNKYILASGYLSGLHLLDFGTSFFNSPAHSQPAGLGLSNLLTVNIIRSRGDYHVFVSTESPSNFFRIDFGNLITNPSPVEVSLGDFGQLSSTDAHTISAVGSTYYSLSVNKSNRIFSTLKFPKDCGFSGKYENEANPGNITYSLQGSYSITLTSKGVNDEVASITKSIVISNLVAPALLINESGKCVANEIVFTGLDQSGSPLSSLLWDFGDGNTDTGQGAAHLYSSTGVYNVVLEATATNTCVNRLEKSISVYAEPIPDFTIPSVTPLCSNQSYPFTNTSVVDPGYPAVWEWIVNGAVVSSVENLTYTFTGTAIQEIKLKASIPGCETEVIQNINSLVEGPVTDFSVSGQCEDSNVTFTNVGAGDSYSWDFDDGTNSTNTSPIHSFSDIGIYDVTLTASNANCINTKTKVVSIYSKPLVNFLLSPPPFSCNGTPSQFNDLTPNPPDSNIASWAWNFGDAGSSQNTSTLKNPQHTYANSGSYSVALLVTTNFFCSATLQLPVTISQSPVANFNHGATCEDVPSNFSDASIGTISTWNWTIGSTAYTTQNPSHTFNNPGNTNATLTVTASNGCIGTVNKPIVVPVKLAPDFSVNRNCVNQQTVFTDLTNATDDPLSLQSWNFGASGTDSGSPVNATFANIGGVTVSLTVTTQSGCAYPVSKLVNIIASPQASFNPSPVAGSPPLSVVFTNTSVNATSYQWAFRDQNNSTSTAVSPTFVYQSLGEYQPELTAFNAQNCFHTTSRTIRVVVPTLDIALDGLELMEFQNGFKPAVTIFNRGNVPVINPALLLNMSGSVIREHVNATITSNTSYRHVFSFEFPASSAVDYFCVETEVMDITPTDNEVCLSLEQSFTTFPPYPNPSKGSFQLDWIMKEAGTVSLTVINSMGQEMQNLEIESVEGLNPLTIETQGLSSGVYFVKIKYQQFTKVYRVFISE